MARIDRSELDEQLDMEFYLERESIPFKLTRGASGMQLNVKNCPNPSCGDSRYRVYLNAEHGRGNCFKCDQTYNKLLFIHMHQGHGDTEWGLTYKAAEEVMREQGWRPKRMTPVAVDQGAVKLPSSHELPTPDGENLLYLEQRGISDEITKYFGLRWCEWGFWLFKNDDGKNETQWFSNRIIIPVYDLDGTLKTFQGRDLTGLSDRKYLFPMGLPGTGRYLYNGQNIIKTKEVTMGEGAFDVAALKIAFDEDVQLRQVGHVGSFGKHLSYGSDAGDDQLGRFLRLKKEQGLEMVTIMWDGESKALVAALNAAKLLTGIGLKVRIALLPFEKDPNEILPEVARQAYYEAKLWTPKLDVMWRLRNPYAEAERNKKKLSAKNPVTTD